MWATKEHPHPRASARLNAQRLYNIAREQQGGRAEERRRATIKDAFDEMHLALTMVETDFPMPRTNIFGSAPVEEKMPGPFDEGDGSDKEAQSGSNKRQLKPQPQPQPPRPGMSGSIGMRH